MTMARPSGCGQMEGGRNISLLHWAVSPFWHVSIISSVLSSLNLRIPILRVKAPSWLPFRRIDSFLSSGRDVFITGLYFSHTWLGEYGKSDMVQQRSCQRSDLSVAACSGVPARPFRCLQAARMATENTHTSTRRQTHATRHCCHQSR